MQGIDCLWELVCRGTNRLFKSFGQVNRSPPHYVTVCDSACVVRSLAV